MLEGTLRALRGTLGGDAEGAALRLPAGTLSLHPAKGRGSLWKPLYTTLRVVKEIRINSSAVKQRYGEGSKGNHSPWRILKAEP